MKYFITPILSLLGGLVAVGIYEWIRVPSIGYVTQILLTVLLLSVLEISLSFDNAVVNAAVLKNMSEVWKNRFLTWGMLIAVFGMRFFFPLLIVSVIGNMSLWDSAVLSFSKPDEYSKMMLESHLAVSAFGGSFLLMVFLNFMISDEKELHWIKLIEKPAAKLAAFQSIELVIALLVMMGIYVNLPAADHVTFLVAYLWGIITFLVVHGISELLENEQISRMAWLKSGFGMFLYLEVLDASFSFDGVVGAFAISNQLVVIMAGLGIGAFFVRGLTLYLVEKNTLSQFMFLEHGAFYALGVLALFMLCDSFFHFSEAVTAISGALILVISILWSIKVDRQSAAEQNQKSPESLE